MAQATIALSKMQAEISKALSGILEPGYQVVPADDASEGSYHFVVIAKDFEGKGHMERQDFIWKALRENISDEKLIKVSLIFTYTPEEAEKLVAV